MVVTVFVYYIHIIIYAYKLSLLNSVGSVQIITPIITIY